MTSHVSIYRPVYHLSSWLAASLCLRVASMHYQANNASLAALQPHFTAHLLLAAWAMTCFPLVASRSPANPDCSISANGKQGY